MTDAVDEDICRMSRAERLASYRELLEGLEDILTSNDAEGADGDAAEAEEMAALVEDVERQLRALAHLLNGEEAIPVTPGLVKKVDKDPQTGEVHTTILYPPPSASTLDNTAAASSTTNAPYEVLFDERDWYPCVVTGVIPPEKPVDRVQYRAWILGHNQEEIVYSEALRPWQPATTAAEDLQSGAACHVIHPRTGRYVEGVVDRLTLEGIVFVQVPQPTAKTSSTASAAETVAVPLSHVRTGKFYAQLHHRPKNDEEKAARRAEQTRLKRQRAAEDRQHAAEKIAKEADEWQTLMGDMMGLDGGGATNKQKKRRMH